LVGAVGIELLRALKARKLLILRNGKREKNRKNAEPRYTRGTREGSSFCIPARTHKHSSRFVIQAPPNAAKRILTISNRINSMTSCVC